ncbi:MAG: glycosyltransferase family 2 protein [Lachnospiraceae bacterium]|nr:glycosyltransferase family 2 protein [Lachnospiraceae bacterium]
MLMIHAGSAEIKISIIVPCYKVEKYVRRALDALLAQTLEEIEIICINDGSPDNCLQILKEYEDKDSRILVIDKPNEGVWKARLDGIRHSSGEYIGFADPDDCVRNDFAEKLYRAAKGENADIVCCGFDRVDCETGRVFSREMTKFCCESFDLSRDPGLMLEVNAALWNKIFRRKLLTNMKQIPEIPGALDDMMFAQLLYIHARHIAFVKESLIRYSVRSDSIISTIRPALLPGIYRAMLDVRRIYEKDNPAMLDYLDGIAFLHLGISLMYRMAGERTEFDRILQKNTHYLNRHFPNWKRNPYISLSYTIRHRGANRKLLLIRLFYQMHLFKGFLAVYRFMIDRFGIDIKW